MNLSFLNGDTDALEAALEALPLGADLRLAFFGREAAPASESVLAIAERIVFASDGRVALDRYDAQDERWALQSFGIRHLPCLAILGPEGDSGVRFYGTLEGFGAAGIAATLLIAAGADAPSQARLRTLLGELAAPACLRLFVTHENEATPGRVRAVAAVALASDLIRTDVLTGPELPALAHALGVISLPTLLLDGRRLSVTLREDALAHEIVKASATMLI